MYECLYKVVHSKIQNRQNVDECFEMAITIHSNFSEPWCKEILATPGIEIIPEKAQHAKQLSVSNTMFARSLSHDTGIIARMTFTRPSEESDAIHGTESCFLLSLGDGLDGITGRLHGGFHSIIMDQAGGLCAHTASPNPIPPATAYLNVDYKKAVKTPGKYDDKCDPLLRGTCAETSVFRGVGVVFVRAWLYEMNGRKTRIKSVVQDREGDICATATSMFISAKPEKI